MSRSMLPAKTPSSLTSQPTTAGLVPSGKATAERKVDAVVAGVRARLAKEDKEKKEEKEKKPVSEADVEVTGRALWADPNSDLSLEDLERCFMRVLRRRIRSSRP